MSTTDEKTPVVNQDEQAPVPQVNGEPIEAVAAEQQQDGEQPAIEEQVIDRELDCLYDVAHRNIINRERCNAFAVKPVTIRLPTPNYPQTLPKSGDNKTNTPSTFIMHPQPTETIQDIRATLLEWIGGYWLGPYSLRIPRSGGGKTTSEEKGRLLGTGKEGVEIREGEKLSDWIEIGEVFSHLEGQDNAERVLVVQREPYSEADARQAVLRLRDYTMPSSEVTPTFATIGLNPGSSIFEGIQTGSLVDSSITDDSKPASVNKPVVKNGKQANKPTKVKPETETDDALFADWKGLPKTDVAKLPLAMPPLPHPSCLRSLIFSPFNPPPPHLKQKGHLIYLTAVTLEGEAVMIVCSTKGWYVARSTAPSVSFDPAPRTTPKEIKSHSLVDLLHALSPLFTSTLRSLQTQASNPALAREPIASVPIPQYPPAYPWIASAPNNSAVNPDLVKTQLAYGYTGAITPDALEGARDWNEELQNAREMPKSTTQERVLRERVMQKTHAEFTAACIRGSMAIARGDLQPINPHEDEKAHMWLANNIFYTKGVNSVDAYTHLGGDEAARISHAKDAAGVKLLNRLDVDNVYLLGHTVVDWQGERWVCQSVLPGIFSRRREDAEDEQAEAPKVDGEGATEAEATTGEKDSAAEPAPDAVKDANEVDNYLVIYGADSEGGIDKLHWDAGMHKIMGKVAASQRLALHKMKDSNGDEYDFWTSVDVKGLRGSDGRRYLLDLPRLSPVDIEFLQKDVEGKLMAGAEETDAKDGVAYPHRVVLLRPELLDSYWDHELKLWARQIQAKKAEEQKEKTDDKAEGAAEQGASESKPAQDDAAAAASTIPADTPRFDLRFNADAFVDQPVKADAETGEVKYQASTQTDESEPSIKAVRDASIFLRTVVVPSLILDVIASNTLGIMDGLSLSKHLHAKGINMRYLGHVMSHIEKYIKTSEGEGVGHLKAISSIVQQEMVFRACKHILRRLVHGQSAENSAAAVSHFLNCLLGSDKNANPVAEYEALDFQDASAPAYTQLTPESLRSEIVAEIATRFRWTLDETYFDQDMRKPQLLKELASRIAFQLDQRAYQFVGTDEESAVEDQDATTKSKKAKKASKTATTVRKTTFEPCDILTLLPVVKSTAPSVSFVCFVCGDKTIILTHMVNTHCRLLLPKKSLKRVELLSPVEMSASGSSLCSKVSTCLSRRIKSSIPRSAPRTINTPSPSTSLFESEFNNWLRKKRRVILPLAWTLLLPSSCSSKPSWPPSERWGSTTTIPLATTLTWPCWRTCKVTTLSP